MADAATYLSYVYWPCFAVGFLCLIPWRRYTGMDAMRADYWLDNAVGIGAVGGFAYSLARVMG